MDNKTRFCVKLDSAQSALLEAKSLIIAQKADFDKKVDDMMAQLGIRSSTRTSRQNNAES